MHGVILYGPPASGKDTITRALHEVDPGYSLFPRLKTGGGKTSGYRMATESEVQALRSAGDVVWENDRYGSTYVVDRPSLWAYLSDQVPVLHLGQVEAVEAVVKATPDAHWLVVALWCPRDVALQRIVGRGTVDVSARLRAWDETQSLPRPDMAINTGEVSAQDAARAIHQRLAGAAR